MIPLLDYSLWWWHWANHEMPPLWRFHVVHHADRDLDASTALRFHFGEMTLAALFRSAQIALIGANRRGVTRLQRMLLVSILFQHSNIRLPLDLESILVRALVTPRMHGIHHANVRDLERSIGVPAWRDPRELTRGKILLMPFRRQRDDRASRSLQTRS